MHTRGEAGRKESLREGRALARLTHPNVVTVYEVGVAGEQVFVAMEYVHGRNLRAWLRDPPPPSPAAILARLIEAGRGLAAAHDQGLVHRDVKPENVVIDANGRARVVDFGLARPLEDIDGTTRSGGQSPNTSSLRGGTPAYMAPERLGGDPGDLRSDQYSYCLTCWEALGGGRQVEPRAVLAGVPSRVTRALQRGLSAAPERRFPSMHALLAELAPRATRRWIAGVAAIAAIGLGVVGYQAGQRERPAPACASPSERLADVWSPARAAAIAAAFEGAGVDYARDTWASARAMLDRYAAEWSRAHARACQETVVLGIATAERHRQRVLCLEGQRLDLAALLERFAAADREVAARALEAIEALPPPSACDRPGEAALSLFEVAQMIERMTLRQARAQARAALNTGDAPAATAELEGLLARARAAGDPVQIAETLVLLGRGDVLGGRYDAARERLLEALRLALEAAQPVPATHAALLLTDVNLERYEERVRNDELLVVAESQVRRAGDPPNLRIELLGAQGREHRAAGRHAEALVAFEAARDLAEALGDRHLLAMMWMDIALSHDGLGDPAKAIEILQRARAEFEAVVGPTHPSLALVHSNLAGISIVVDDLEAVAEHTARSVAITRANYGDAHPYVAGGHLHLSTLKAAMGRPDEAVEEARTARRLFEAVHGPRHPHVALATCATAAALLARGDLEEALTTAREGASMQAELLPAGDCDHLTCVAVEGTILHALGRHRETLAAVEPLLPVAEESQCTGSERDDLTLVVARALFEARGRAARTRILALLGALGAELDPESAAEVARLRAALG